MEKIDKLEKLLRTCSYAELSVEQRREISEYVNSEEEYESMRLVNQHLKDENSRSLPLAPSPEVLKRIKGHVRSTSSVGLWKWLSLPVPTYATAAIAIAVGVGCWWAGSSRKPQPTLVEKTERIVDTVYFSSRPDTIFIDRVVYIPEKEAPVAGVTDIGNQPTVPTSRGISMKEKEELERLLVSGLR